ALETGDVEITVDTTPPEVAITSIEDSNGKIEDESTTDSSVVLFGTAEVGSTVKVYDGDNELGNATVASDGTWSYTATSLSLFKTYYFNAKATDAVGNESAATEDFLIGVFSEALDPNPPSDGPVVVEPIPIPVVDTSVVVFDLTTGMSSSHSGRVFDENVSYTIYIVTDTYDNNKSLDSDSWWSSEEGSNPLGLDDKLVLVSADGSELRGRHGRAVTDVQLRVATSKTFLQGGNMLKLAPSLVWESPATAGRTQPLLFSKGAAYIGVSGLFGRSGTYDLNSLGMNEAYNQARLWEGFSWATLGANNRNEDDLYILQLPTSIAVSQPMS
ncbi:Ig-like domain-containing protein, partial [Marinomonas transparens]